MAVLRICTYPEPVLRKKAKKVSGIDKKVLRLIDDMIDTLHAAPGVGLAANQVGVPLRVIVVHEPEKEVVALINPEIVKKEGERVVSEGCLSVPGYQGEVKRSERVKVKAVDRNGKSIRIKGDDLMGQVLEHEIDHLDGVLYIDKLHEDKLYKIVPEDEEAAEAETSEEVENKA
jgi:peptide deformylase